MLEQQDHVSRDSGRSRLGPEGNRKRANASAWIRRNPGVKLDSRDVPRLANLETPAVLDRVERLLINVDKATELVGEEININQPEWYAHAWATGREEISGLASLLQEMGWIEIGERTLGPFGQLPVRITAGGWTYLEEVHRRGADSVQGFVAMSFSPGMRRLYDDAIAPAIVGAGYKAHRVDRREYTGKIDDEIVAQIRRSRFVVADYTQNKAGVYWEAGFAAGLGREVFFTCCKHDLNKIHFDVRQFNTIVWRSRRELRDLLRHRIEAVLGRPERD